MIARFLGYIALGITVLLIISLPLSIFGSFLCGANFLGMSCEDVGVGPQAFMGLMGIATLGFAGFFAYGLGRVVSDWIDDIVGSIQRRKKAKK